MTRDTPNCCDVSEVASTILDSLAGELLLEGVEVTAAIWMLNCLCWATAIN
jgi:hypothetical protein